MTSQPWLDTFIYKHLSTNESKHTILNKLSQNTELALQFFLGSSGNGCYCDWLKARVKGFSLFPYCLRVLRLMKIRYRRHPLIFWDGWWEIGKIGSVSSLKDWKVPNGSLYSTITSTRATWGQFSPTRNWFA